MKDCGNDPSPRFSGIGVEDGAVFGRTGDICVKAHNAKNYLLRVCTGSAALFLQVHGVTLD
jgi:uncharacterized membrane protein